MLKPYKSATELLSDFKRLVVTAHGEPREILFDVRVSSQPPDPRLYTYLGRVDSNGFLLNLTAPADNGPNIVPRLTGFPSGSSPWSFGCFEHNGWFLLRQNFEEQVHMTHDTDLAVPDDLSGKYPLHDNPVVAGVPLYYKYVDNVIRFGIVEFDLRSTEWRKNVLHGRYGTDLVESSAVVSLDSMHRPNLVTFLPGNSRPDWPTFFVHYDYLDSNALTLPTRFRRGMIRENRTNFLDEYRIRSLTVPSQAWSSNAFAFAETPWDGYRRVYVITSNKVSYGLIEGKLERFGRPEINGTVVSHRSSKRTLALAITGLLLLAGPLVWIRLRKRRQTHNER